MCAMLSMLTANARNVVKSTLRVLSSQLGLEYFPLKGIVFGAIVAFLSAALFLSSSMPWAGNVHLPHSPVLDTLYKWLDPFLLYMGTGWVFVFLMFYPGLCIWKSQSPQRRFLQSLALSFLFLLFMTAGLYVLSAFILKPGFARLRPRSRLEHSLIAAALSGRVSKADCACLPTTMSLCPIGQAVIQYSKLGDSIWPPAESAIIDLVIQTGWSRAETVAHIDYIYAGAGTGPWTGGIEANLATLREISEWQQRAERPFFVCWLSGEEERCEIPNSCPSNHVLRQAMVFFLSIVVVFWKWPHIPYFRRHPRKRWSLLFLSLAALAWCMWGRVYGYRHTWSDEMISIGAAGSIALIITAVIETAQAKTAVIGKRMLERVGLRNLLDSAHVMFIYFDRNDKFHLWNKACEQITGYNAAEIQTLDDYVRKIYPSSEPKAMKRRLRSAISKFSLQTNIVTRITTKAGKRKLILWNAAPIIGPASRVVGKLSIGIEVNRIGGRLSNIGFVGPTLLHDFQYDMEVIWLHAQKALEVEKENEDVRTRLVTIFEIAKRLSEDAASYRTYILGDASSAGLVDLQCTVEDAVKLVEGRANAGNITIRKALEGDLPRIPGHEGAIRHALVNLLRNAIGAIEERVMLEETCPRELAVELKRTHWQDKTAFEIEIIDSGIGMSDHMQEVLEKGLFYQMSLNEDDNIGLGLLEVIFVITDHNGTLQCSRLAEGGTRIVIYFPYDT